MSLSKVTDPMNIHSSCIILEVVYDGIMITTRIHVAHLPVESIPYQSRIDEGQVDDRGLVPVGAGWQSSVVSDFQL